MKTFIIRAEVKKVRGAQYFEIKARSKEEALELHRAGKSTFTDEEIEVTDLGEETVEAK